MYENENTSGKLTPEEQDLFNYSIKGDAIKQDNVFASYENEDLSGENEDLSNETGKVKKKISKKLLIGIPLIIAVVIAAIIAIWFFFFKGNLNYVLYVKDNEIFFSDYSEKGTFQLTSDFTGDFDDEEIGESFAQKLGLLTFVCEDGTVFYWDKIEKDGASLFYKNTNKPDEEVVKIDTGITSYFFASSDAKYVTYMKDDILYEYSVKEGSKEKIASEVQKFYMSKDGSALLYASEEDSLYYKTRNQSETKIDSDIQSLHRVSEDLKLFYYTKGENLYVNTPGGDRTKIASEIQSVKHIYDTGEIYYTAKDKENGDMSLYYYGGGSATEISDSIKYVEAVSADSVVIVYSEYDEDYNTTYYVSVKSKVSKIDETKIDDIMLSPDGEFLYYLTNKSSDSDTADLYRINITGNRVEKEKLYASDVYAHNVTMLKDGTVVYCKDFRVNDDNEYYGFADLYMNGLKIDYDVHVYKYWLSNSVTCIESEGKLLYYTDWDFEKGYGTLKVFDRNKQDAKKISDDVHSFVITPDNKVSYLKDFSSKYNRGDLYLYDGKESKKLDEDVSYIIPVIDLHEYFLINGIS